MNFAPNEGMDPVGPVSCWNLPNDTLQRCLSSLVLLLFFLSFIYRQLFRFAHRFLPLSQNDLRVDLTFLISNCLEVHSFVSTSVRVLLSCPFCAIETLTLPPFEPERVRLNTGRSRNNENTTCCPSRLQRLSIDVASPGLPRRLHYER